MDNYEKNNIDVISEDDTETMKQPGGWKKEVKDWIITIVAAVIIAYVLQSFVLQFACVSGDSMKETLHDRDVLYVNKLLYTPERGDIVIVDMEKLYGPDNPQRYHVKRVVAVENDSIYIDFNTGDVFVNGELIDEPYIKDRTTRGGSYLYSLEARGEFSQEKPLVLKEGEVFVMGDNRLNSLDSRENGPYTVDMIEGHALFRFWPLDDFGGAGNYEFVTETEKE